MTRTLVRSQSILTIHLKTSECWPTISSAVSRQSLLSLPSSYMNSFWITLQLTARVWSKIYCFYSVYWPHLCCDGHENKPNVNYSNSSRKAIKKYDLKSFKNYCKVFRRLYISKQIWLTTTNKVRLIFFLLYENSIKFQHRLHIHHTIS